MKCEPLFDLRLLWDQAINLMISQNSQSACPKYSFLVFCHSSRWVSFKPVQNSIELAKWWQQTKMLLKLSYFRNNKKMNVERGITWNWASSGSPARISSVTKWTPRCWGRRCNWKMDEGEMMEKLKRTIYHLPLQPSVRPDGQTRATGIWREQRGLQERRGSAFFSLWQKKKFFEGKANIRRISRLCQTFYRTACLSEGRRHGSGSVSRGGSRLRWGRTGGFCALCVPVWCRRVVAVPVDQNYIGWFEKR